MEEKEKIIEYYIYHANIDFEITKKQKLFRIGLATPLGNICRNSY
jgi:hypothetical protein